VEITWALAWVQLITKFESNARSTAVVDSSPPPDSHFRSSPRIHSISDIYIVEAQDNCQPGVPNFFVVDQDREATRDRRWEGYVEGEGWLPGRARIKWHRKDKVKVDRKGGRDA